MYKVPITLSLHHKVHGEPFSKQAAFELPLVTQLQPYQQSNLATMQFTPTVMPTGALLDQDVEHKLGPEINLCVKVPAYDKGKKCLSIQTYMAVQFAMTVTVLLFSRFRNYNMK